MSSHPLEGVSKLINLTVASVGAGATTINARPNPGCVWEVLFLKGTQDDGAVVQSWAFTDPDGTNSICNHTTTAAWKWLHFGAVAENADTLPIWGGPLLFTYDRYATFSFTASAAAKNGYVIGLVREFRGVAREV